MNLAAFIFFNDDDTLKSTHKFHPDQYYPLKFLVKSFTRPNAEYPIIANMDRALLLSRTCPDYVQHRPLCKHIYLTPRIYRGMETNYGREHVLPQEPREPIGIENDLENEPSPFLKTRFHRNSVSNYKQ
ncbi:hypothetical protein BC939DRAFT_475256 [Gamsiella multidivaricata]|uniref:uncharacterized protein n=1 Tax=Gamsiella multidivaricata TaxID=101098 RepID=UPI00221F0358|nr:uncharacterized protein BC939DRAFT_475256 [Gamsiella multidivaricata]KAI7827670.1 hypothetical protein BC939DRAFT_475256 [Gamsiella multidivaricata]